MKKITLGILAHVDAGKTTLTESILLKTGMIRNAGRVDNGDAFLDTELLEKKRGVTIVSKQAVIDIPEYSELNLSGQDMRITIIDTPGHVDFIGETERAMSVLDMAVLVVSGPDGVTDSTKRLASLLGMYHVPYIIYVNKMDMCEKDETQILQDIREHLTAGAVASGKLIRSMEKRSDDSVENTESSSVLDIKEEIAALSETTIETFLETGDISTESITGLLYGKVYHPVFFGSALRNIGTQDLVSFITAYVKEFKYRKEPSAKVFKISFEDGHKLAFVKVTGGSYQVRDIMEDERLEGAKISQIRLYSGGRYESIGKAEAGDVVTFSGLENAFIGMGLGGEMDDERSYSKPVLRYRMILPIDTPVIVFYPKLRELTYENPLLSIEHDSDTQEIYVSVMGEFQLEILAEMIQERYNVKVTFDEGSLIYKETISSPVMGYGHFEPLRHYSEVQLLLEPLPEGSGIQIASDLSVSELDINWQKTILSTLERDLPPGVLTGAELTDIRITLVNGRSHNKHSDSQDFREATRRAVRQALMKTESILLEPYLEFHIEVPLSDVGKVMTDMNQMDGKCSLESQSDEVAVITGYAPARTLKSYQTELTRFTSGKGRVGLRPGPYRPCTSEYMEGFSTDYDPEADSKNPPGSIFISHGAGYYVPWFECEEHMHLESRESDYFLVDEESSDEALRKEAEKIQQARSRQTPIETRLEAIGTDEIDKILMNSTHANAGKEKKNSKRVYLRKGARLAKDRAEGYGSTAVSNGKQENPGQTNSSDKYKKKMDNLQEKPKYLLVDGYNIIHAWDELKSLLSNERGNGGSFSDRDSLELEGARYRLLDIMSEYRVMKGTEVIVVFDAYNVKGHFTEKMDYLGVHVVYTREAETADQYISRFTVQNTKYMDITVATSDGLIQLIIRGENSRLMSARELELDIKNCRNAALSVSREQSP